ncbi:MAG: DUF1566 domain-containing protein [Campylobacterales bacterium]|nr:DUF1566 domain-containing protein [Campylobacterales bacterium]
MKFKSVLASVALLSSMSTALQASKGFEFELDNTQNGKVSITSSRSLHYGVLSIDDFKNKDSDFNLKFSKPIMIDRQPYFLDLSKVLAPNTSSTTVDTDISFEDLGHTYNTNSEYMLFTEFDDFSKPAIMNYATIFSIALETISSSGNYGSTFLTKTKQKVEATTDFLNDVGEKVQTTTSFFRDKIEGVKTIYELANKTDEYMPYADNLLNALDSIDNVADVLSTTKSEAIAGEAVSLKSFFSRVYRAKVGTPRAKKSDEKAKDYLRALAFEIIFKQMLTPFSKDDEFYYPKDFSSFSKVIIDFESSSLKSISIEDLSRIFARISLGHKVSTEDKNIAKIASKMLIATSGGKLVQALKVDATSIEGLAKIAKLKNTALNAIKKVNMQMVMNFSKELATDVIQGFSDSADEIIAEFSSRVASYAIPGAGWGRAIVDLGKLANTGGKFAYDFATAPREVPFSIANGEVGEPFSIDMKKYSYLVYPDGSNSLDPYSDGNYNYESYFLYGNAPKGYFNATNINNRDATLAVSGITYSYEMRIGDYDTNGADIFSTLSSEDFVNNTPVGFSFKVYKDALSNKQLFESNITGVYNSHQGLLDKDSYIKSTLNKSSDYYEFKDDDTKNYSQFHNISYLENISQVFKKDFSEGGSKKTYWQNYQNKKGIQHLTPGIFEIETQINIKAPKGSIPTADTVFKDSHKMFVLSPVSQGYETNVYDAKGMMVPFLGLVDSNKNELYGGRWFEYDSNSGQYYFCFKINEEQNKIITSRGVDIAIALYHRDTAKNKNLNTTIYTLKKTDGVKDTYRLPIDNKGYFIGEDINSTTANTMVVAWLDARVEKFAEYSGIPLENIIEDFHTELKANNTATTANAIYKAFSYRAVDSDTKAIGYTPEVPNEPFIELPQASTAILYMPESTTLDGKTITATTGDEIVVTFDKNYAYKDEIIAAKDLNQPYKIKYTTPTTTSFLEALFDEEKYGLRFAIPTDEAITLINMHYPKKKYMGEYSYTLVSLPENFEMVAVQEETISSEQNTTIEATTPLKKTGQTTSYSNYDDGHYQAGVNHSYTRDATKEIVTDNVTKLVWQDNSDAKELTKTWQEAIDYCEALDLGGYSDWRLPDIKELQSIVDDSKYYPAINAVFENITSDLYWSSTTDASYTSNAWYVYFSDGSTYSYNETFSRYVRCVRGGQ